MSKLLDATDVRVGTSLADWVYVRDKIAWSRYGTPDFFWHAGSYVAGAPGHYPNMGMVGTHNLAEPATVGHRPLRLPYTGTKYVYVPSGAGNNVTNGVITYTGPGIIPDVPGTWQAADMSQTGGVSFGTTWTINRAAGNVLKTVVVDRTVALFDGSTNLLSASDHASLDVSSTSSMTIVYVYRQWSSTGSTWLTYKFAAGVGGHNIFTSGGVTYGREYNAAGAFADAVGPGEGVGLNVVTTRRAPTQRCTTVNNVSGAIVNPAVHSVANAAPLYIGSANIAGTYKPMEWIATLVFNSYLTDVQIAGWYNAVTAGHIPRARS